MTARRRFRVLVRRRVIDEGGGVTVTVRALYFHVGRRCVSFSVDTGRIP